MIDCYFYERTKTSADNPFFRKKACSEEIPMQNDNVVIGKMAYKVIGRVIEYAENDTRWYIWLDPRGEVEHD